MSLPQSELPIVAALPQLSTVLDSCARVLLEAPPGAGKSTYLPLWLVERGASPAQRILLIQPRRLAAASVAAYLARQNGSALGDRVGLRTRFDHKVSDNTVIEVVTEGIFLRQVQRDPELQGVRYVLFDEFHERSWQADLGLGLAIESQLQWRDQSKPLQLIVMSATLPSEKILSWVDAPNVTTEGRSYPVAIEYSSLGRADPIDHIVGAIRRALMQGSRRVLVFLAGWQQMQKVGQRIEQCDCDVSMLHSSVPPAQLQQALVFAEGARQSVVLATNIAETSLTIPGVDTVIDSGQVRRAQFDSKRGMDRLATGWISRASAQQRAGRAGRLGPGRCIRLWSSEQQGRLLAHDPAEIHCVDLAPLVLELALWGGDDPAQVLPELPPTQRLQEARLLLQRLHALDDKFRITTIGQAMGALGLHPRLARLVLHGVEQGRSVEATLLAALLSEGDFLAGKHLPVDIDWRLRILSGKESHGDDSSIALQRGVMQRIQQLAKQLQQRGGGRIKGVDTESAGELLLAAFPDRVARRRSGDVARYLCVDGTEVVLDESDPLRAHEWIVIAEHDGNRAGARIRLAAAVDYRSVEQTLADQIADSDSAAWNEGKSVLVARRLRKLGAIVLDEKLLALGDESAGLLWLQLLREKGLEWLQLPDAAMQWLQRARWLRTRASQWPDFSDAILLAELEDWLLPYLNAVRKLSDLRALDFGAMLRARLSYVQQQELEKAAPTHYVLPTGNRHPLAYREGEPPKLAARLTEFYGLDTHPQIAGEPLLLELLSPAYRPLQMTSDLPNFWRSAYPEVRKEMKGRYPKHFWPEQPWSAIATATTKKNMEKNFERNHH
ncbi:MAG TPA: ATP-dependent helicase HrpB [Spongiibacteraceae bacterium]|nr:ATP-dependent helicase HrpB [Spongiibacteraceae bacterium]